MRPTFLRTLIAAALATVALAARAEYPDRLVRIIVPYGAGSSTDVLSRMVAKQLGTLTDQTFMVDDRPGAEAAIGMRDAAKSPADGYTVLITTSSTQVLSPNLYNSPGYDPVRDFAPVSTLARFSLLMNVGRHIKFQNARELIADARANPGKYSFASGSTATRIGGELLQQVTGIKLLHVPYKSNPAALNDVMTGQVDMMFIDYPTSLPFLSLGVRPLAVTGDQRISALPNVPTVKEEGIKGYEVTGWYGVYLPAQTPPAVVARLTALIGKAMNTAEAEDFLARNAISKYLVQGADLAKLQADETAQWGEVIRAAGIPKQ